MKYEEDLEARRDKGAFGFLSDLADAADSLASSMMAAVSLDPPYKRLGVKPPKAPQDVHLATGYIDVTKDVLLQVSTYLLT